MVSIFHLFKVIRLMRLYDVDRILLKKTLRKRRILGFFSEKKRIIKMSPGERIYHCLNACGPLFVKFGQALSTRSDLLSEEILQHLQRLQDRAPAVDTDVIFNIIRHELGPLSDTLKIDKTPLGTASLAQVHRGKVLATGEDIAIKVLLPGIEKRVHENLRVIYMVLAVFDKLAGKRVRRLKLMTLYQEFAQTTYRELNLRNEAANASQMKSMFSQGDRGLYIHKIFWDYATSKVLVTEYMPGICIKYISRIEKALTVKQRKILAVQGVQLFFEQMLTYRFFHADLHPGNILIDCCETPCFQLIDFGIVGTLDEKDQRYLAENLLAFFKRDYQRVAQLHLESGWVSSDIRLESLY